MGWTIVSIGEEVFLIDVRCGRWGKAEKSGDRSQETEGSGQ
jgi:hypothetical protein